MFIFFGTYNYISSNYISANITPELGYNQSFYDLEESRANLSSNIDDIKFAAENITESDSSVVFVAWNGLTGLAATIRLFFNVANVAIDVWNAILPGLAFLPDWVKVLAEMAILIWIVLIIIGAFKGEAKT